MSGEIGLDDPELLKGLTEAMEEIPCIYAVINNLVDQNKELRQRVDELEGQSQHLLQLMSGGMNKTTKRAYLLADAVKTANQGYITRAQARNVLIEDGVKPRTKPTNDAMAAAAKMFGMIHTKNKAGEVVLGRK